MRSHGNADYERLRATAANLGLDEDWQRFLEAVAHHESRGRIDAENTSRSEASAARSLFNSPANAWLRECGRSESDYAWGSGGWFGLLPASAMRAFRGTALACEDPRRIIHDPVASIVAAVEYARRVMRWSDWARSPKTWRALNRGWAAPGLTDATGEAVKDIDKRWYRALDVLGVPHSWGEQPVTPPPDWDPFAVVVGAWETEGVT